MAWFQEDRETVMPVLIMSFATAEINDMAISGPEHDQRWQTSAALRAAERKQEACPPMVVRRKKAELLPRPAYLIHQLDSESEKTENK